ncbi:metal-dependent hydrolase [Desulfothermobacter acidiphilus]|uniref:metal-dependent hydrolase n=1 Tax=Desulfothermobacter acidiphilus TaxID=1938353 RepID=UPI003F8AEC55
MQLRFLGHAAVWMSDGSIRLIVDPFLTGNPQAAARPEEIAADIVVVTHAHGDHWGDALTFCKRGALLVSNFEITNYAERRGAKRVCSLNTGGRYDFAGGWIKLVPAWHSSSFPDGTYGGMPTGVVISLGGKKIYHAGDTALLAEMEFIGKLGLEVALLPIGGTYTMDPEDALQALELLKPKMVVPIHYNTFPAIQQDPDAFIAAAERYGVEGKKLRPGEELTLG